MHFAICYTMGWLNQIVLFFDIVIFQTAICYNRFKVKQRMVYLCQMCGFTMDWVSGYYILRADEKIISPQSSESVESLIFKCKYTAFY
jgi:hypothetical protein